MYILNEPFHLMRHLFLSPANLIMERGAELSVQGRYTTDSSWAGTGSGSNGGAHSAAGGVADGLTIDDASTAYGSIYAPTTHGRTAK